MKACVLALCAAALIAGSYASPMQGLRVGKTFDGTAYDFISSQSNLKTLTAAINAAGLQSTLSGSGTFTIFAPQDSAFSSNNMADYKVKYLLDSKHKTNLQSLLEYHVIGKEYRSSDLTDQLSLATLEGQDLEVVINQTIGLRIDDVTCGKAQVVSADHVTSNGIVHIIDTVFVPFGVFCPDTVFAAEQRSQGRISAYGYDCRRKGTKHITSNANGTKPVGIAADDSSRTLIWANDMDYPHGSPTSWISSINYDGSNKKHTLDFMIDPQGLAIDHQAQKLYFTQHSGYNISRANLDGSNVETLVDKPNNRSFQPADVAIDPVAGKMFAAIEGPQETQEGYIAMFDLDGGHEEAIVPYPVVRPYGLCVDSVHQHVFYIVGGHGGQIRCVAYGTTPCVNDVVQDILDYPYMCSVDNAWTPYGGPTQVVFSQANYPGQLFFSSADGGSKSEIKVISSDDLIAPEGVAFGCVGKDY